MGKNSKRVLASAAALCLVLSSTPALAAEATTAPERLAGAGRVETAIKVAEASWKGNWKDSKTAVLAGWVNEVDALAVSPLAYKLHAPILLNDAKDSINAETLKALKAQGVTKVYIATGAGVISDKAVEALKAEKIEVVRLGGSNRYATAKNIYDEFIKQGGKADTVALVAGTGLADALSVASIAAKEGMPILMTSGKDAVAADLAEVAKAAKKVYAIGGEGVISKALVDTIKAERLGGSSRFETNAAVIKGFASKVKFDKVYLANGVKGLVDALTGSVLAAQTDSPIVLANGTLDASVKEQLKGKVNEKTSIVALGGEGVVTTDLVKAVKDVNKAEATGDLKIESVSANNLKQIFVSFSGKIDETEATKVDNYELVDSNNANIAIDKVDIEGNTIVVSLKDDAKGETVKNQTAATLTVKKKVAGADVKKEVKFFDNTIPTVQSVKVIGESTVKVTFSEPVKAKAEAFSVNEGEYYIKDVTASKSGKEQIVKLYSRLSEGKLKVTVNDGAKDYANFSVAKTTLETEVKADKEAPKVVGFEKATPNGVTIIFDEDLNPELVSKDIKSFYHTNTTNTVDAKAGNADVTLDGNKLTLNFTGHKLPNGKAYIYIDGKAIGDYWSNKNTQQLVVPVDVEVDTTKPEVTEIKQESEQEITVVFSEKVDTDTIKAANFKLLDKDGKEIQKISNISMVKDSLTKATVKFTEKLGGKYSLVVEKVKDLAGNEINKVTKDFTVEDKTAVDTAKVTAVVYGDTATSDKDLLTLVVKYPEAMRTEKDAKYSISDLENYQINGKILKNIEGVKLTVIDGGKGVEIIVPEKELKVQKDQKLIISRVADAAGNTMVAPSFEVTIADPGKVAAKSVKLIALDKVEVTFDGELKKFEGKDLEVAEVGGAKLNVSRVTTSKDTKGNTVATLTLEKEIGYDAQSNAKPVEVRTITETPDLKIVSENRYGEKLAVKTTIEDCVAPKLAVYADGDHKDKAKIEATEKVITLTFEEAIKQNTVSTVTFSVSNCDNAAVTAVEVEGKTVKLTLDKDVTANATVTQKAVLTDIAGNEVKDLSGQVFVVKAAVVAPPVAAVNKANLVTAIADAKAKKQADYTPASWTAADLANVIAAAEAVNAKADATQVEVDAAIKTITDAVAKLAK